MVSAVSVHGYIEWFCASDKEKRSHSMAPSAPRVFISYSHDSTEHTKAVLALAQRLRQDGVDAWIDQYENGTPEEGWPRWMLNRLDWAQTVLLVCTEIYYRRFRGHDDPDQGKGADWEGTAEIKAQAAVRWCAAVNATRRFGLWDYVLAKNVSELIGYLDALPAPRV